MDGDEQVDVYPDVEWEIDIDPTFEELMQSAELEGDSLTGEVLSGKSEYNPNDTPEGNDMNDLTEVQLEEQVREFMEEKRKRGR